MSLLSKRGTGPPDIQVQVADREPQAYYLNTSKNPASNYTTGPTSTSNSSIPHPHVPVVASLFDVGIFKDTLAPSLALHSGLALIAWGVGRATNRVDAKDLLWSSAPVANAWWSAVGRRVAAGMPLDVALARLSWPERLLLTGVSAWGARLFYRTASQSVKRGKDDPRYEEAKKEEGFWNQSLVSTFLPEAVFQTVISLPFTAPFRHEGTVLTGYHPSVQMLAVGVFSVGFALEVFADWQLDAHKLNKDTGMKRDGVWSIVRHPNYLGDALMHMSFPILLYGSDMLAPIELLAPIANYVFLRYVGGVRENEASQEARYVAEAPEEKVQLDKWRSSKNAFWPGVQELENAWTWVVLGCGAVGILLEQGLRRYH